MKEFDKIERLAYAAKELANSIMDVDFDKAVKILELVDDTEFLTAMDIIREAIDVKRERLSQNLSMKYPYQNLNLPLKMVLNSRHPMAMYVLRDSRPC